MKTLTYCPSTLAEGFDTYSPVALKKLFNGRKISHIIPYVSIEKSEIDATKFMNNRKHISISGVQNKYSMLLRDNTVMLTDEGEQGLYIFKPKPADLRLAKEIPANENLTMQIANQVYGIETAVNGLCFYETGEPAYLTRRFDVAADGSKIRKEDFASLAGVTASGMATDLKYNSSYEEVADLIKRYIPAWRVELLKFYRIVVFNFLFSNGDAHLKNFSVIETGDGDFKLSPAYDLLNTHIHVDDTDFALDRGLFAVADKKDFKFGTKTVGTTFKVFGLKIGLPEKTVDTVLSQFIQRHLLMDQLVSHSFLSEKTKRTYLQHYSERRNRLADFKL